MDETFTFPVDLAISEPRRHESLLVAGWGFDENFRLPIDLQSLTVPVVDQIACSGSDSYQGLVTPRMFCAGFFDGRGDSCTFDSGSPMPGGLANTVLTGVVSWGNGCASPNFPGVYTKLSDPEIRSVVASFAPAPLYEKYSINNHRWDVESYGTTNDVYVQINKHKRRIWGSRKYADLQATTDEYCRCIGFEKLCLGYQRCVEKMEAASYNIVLRKDIGRAKLREAQTTEVDIAGIRF